MLSKTSEYALRAVLHLAREGADLPVRASEISRVLDVPANYLSKILHALARADILTSERGPRGGFRLARPANELTLAAVIEPFDPLMQQRSCLLGRPECSDATPCAVHDRWKQVSEPVAEFFRQTMVADLLEPGVTPLPLAKGGGTDAGSP